MFDSLATPRPLGHTPTERNPFDVVPNPPHSPGPSSPHPLLTPTRAPSNSPFVPTGQFGASAEVAPSWVNHQTQATPSFANSIPTTSLSLHAPDFTMSLPPTPKSANKSTNKSAASQASTTSALKSQLSSALMNKSDSTPSSSGSSTPVSKGQIHVKLIQARGLSVRAPTARPYVVVTFENSEFISRDPTDETDREVKGTATSRHNPSNSTSSAMNALGAIHDANIKASAKANGGSNGTSPSSSFGSNKSNGASNGGGLFSRLSAHNPVWKHEVSFDVTNEKSAIRFNVYDRAAVDPGFLGTVEIKPVLVHDQTVDQWYKLLPYENEVVTGEMRVQITYEQYKTKRALTPRDFEFLKLIGRGTFGKVFQVRKKDTKRIYAMKVLSKKEIVAKKEVAHTIGERKILQRSLDSPFLVGLKFSFQTDKDLYLVTDFKSGGELFWHLQRETKFSEERARFYIAELVLALEHLHKYNIVYRDLKPENILLDATGHVALCDFGLSKADLRPDELTTTFCGTTEYLAPEILLDEHGYSKIVDFWSLGVLLFEMCCGWSPFYAEDTQQMYRNICFGKIRFPKGVINEDGKQFVKGLLNRNPKHRLGAQRDAAELKEHPFFKSIDWHLLSLKQVTPPFKPAVESDESTANFDPEFTGADISDIVDLDDDDDGDWDDEDPSEDWVSASLSSSFSHLGNGPLGSEKVGSMTSLPGSGTTSPAPTNGNASGKLSRNPSTSSNKHGKGITIKGLTKDDKTNGGSAGRKKKKNRDGDSGSPLTNSVQENFRGFTYSGESVTNHADAFMHHRKGKHDDDEDMDQGPGTDPNTEDEYEDFGKSAGRYANVRRKGFGFTGMDDEMN
ncbi:Serine/threonine-protein kinase [Marasmius crinis-equi]|uniref:Serine/threonine-protein kinase n=1 Tax=Marasmius crinis-equi TaxID=585013 RepID=A0ABR3G056_9AGAR